MATPVWRRPNSWSHKIDKFGTPEAYNHYAVGWAYAMDTPYQWTKQVASHWGGTRNGTIVHWPSGIQATGELRHQFRHVIDVAPTILEAAGLPDRSCVNGVQQSPVEGACMVYSFDDAMAADRHDLQYFEMFCNRGIYHEGWTAVTRHSVRGMSTAMPAFDDDTWELYAPARLDAGPRPGGRAAGAAARPPTIVHDRGGKYNVVPIDDRRFERFEPSWQDGRADPR